MYACLHAPRRNIKASQQYELHRKLKHIKSPQRRASRGNGKTPLVIPTHSAHEVRLEGFRHAEAQRERGQISATQLPVCVQPGSESECSTMLCTRCVSERCRVDPQYSTSYVYTSYKRRMQRRRKQGSCALIKTSKTTPTACGGALEKRDLEADHSCFLQSNRTKEHRHLCFQGTKILNIIK